MTEHECRAGDQVQLVDAVPGRPALRVGLQGRVEVGDELPEIWAMVTVVFPGAGGRAWRLHRRHLRPVGSEGDLR